MITALQIAQALDGKASGSGFTAKCPAHDDHSPSLSITDSNGMVLVKCHAGCSQEDVIGALSGLGLWHKEKSFEKTDLRLKLWNECSNYNSPSSEPLRQYIRNRGLDSTFAESNVIKFAPDARYYGDAKELIGTFGACFFQLKDQDGEVVGIQRVYLNREAQKLDLAKEFPNRKKEFEKFSSKKILGNAGSIQFDAPDSVLCVAEGPETALAVRQATRLPTWSALNVSVMKNLKLPESVNTLHIFADVERSGAGIKAAKELASRCSSEGVTCFLHVPPQATARVKIDWLEVLVEFGTESFTNALRDAKAFLANDFTHEENWGSIVPLENYLVPDFPVELLPRVLREFVVDVSASTETPVDLAAMMALGSVSVAALGKFEVETQRNFFEPVTIYSMCVLAPGNRKTAVLNLCKAPLEAWEKDQAAAMAFDVAQAQEEFDSQQATVKKLRDTLGGKDQSAEAKTRDRIKEIVENYTIVPVFPRLIATDITPERAITLLAEQKERIGLMSDEGGMIETFGGRYNGGVPNLDLILKAYDGSAYRYDRKNGPPIYLKCPLITAAICPQPSVLEALQKKPEFRGRGLVARFLYSVPMSRLGYRSCETERVKQSVIDEYAEMITALLDYNFNAAKMQREGVTQLKLSSEAYQLWKSYWKEIEAKLGPDAELETLSDWASKLPGATARIAALIHLAENSQIVAISHVVSEAAMSSAIEITRVLQLHARKAFHLMSADPHFQNAKKILRYVQKQKLKKFTVRQIHKGLQSSFATADSVRSALKVLEERNYVRALDSVKTAYRPSETYELNTEAFS